MDQQSSDQNSTNRGQILWIAVVIALIVGALAGFLLGKQTYEKAAEEEISRLSAIVDYVYPPPPETITTLSGTVLGIHGATITLEINSIDDYLPILDGRDRRKEVRYANFSGTTEFIETRVSERGEFGLPPTSPITIDNIEVGNVVRVRSEQNIRDLEEFDVTRIELRTY